MRETDPQGQSEEQPCALRALTLCDGQVLEHPDRALTECLCAQLRHLDGKLSPAARLLMAIDRQELIERTMANPSLPF